MQMMISSGGFQILKKKNQQNRHNRVQSAITLMASKIIRKDESSMDIRKLDFSVKGNFFISKLLNFNFVDYVKSGENKKNGVWNVKGYKVPTSVMTDIK